MESDDRAWQRGHGVVAIDFENVWRELPDALPKEVVAAMRPWMLVQAILDLVRCEFKLPVGCAFLAIDVHTCRGFIADEDRIRIARAGVLCIDSPRVQKSFDPTERRGKGREERRRDDQVDQRLLAVLAGLRELAGRPLPWVVVATHDKDFCHSLQQMGLSGTHTIGIGVAARAHAIRSVCDDYHVLDFPMLVKVVSLFHMLASTREEWKIAITRGQQNGAWQLLTDVVRGVQRISERNPTGSGIYGYVDWLVDEPMQERITRWELAALTFALANLGVIVEREQGKHVVLPTHPIVTAIAKESTS